MAYVDSDFLFVDEWAGLDWSGTLLTPHWRDGKDKWAYLHGLYNAGFVATEDAAAMAWWADLCLWKCEQNYADGLFVDQRYLDLLPVYYPATICQDRGYNIGPWNMNRENPKCVHLSTRHKMDASFRGWLEEYDRRVEETALRVPVIEPSSVWMVAQKVGSRWIGPAGHQTFNHAGAEEALKLYEAGMLGDGEWKVMPLPYSQDTPNIDIPPA